MFFGTIRNRFGNPGAVARFVAVFAVAFLLASALIDGVEAKRIPANGVSIASRVQNQKDSCAIEGGSFTSKDTAFGSTITTCTGGSGGTYTCVNTVQSTDCHKGLVRPEEKPDTRPDGGVIDESGNGGAGNHADGGVGGVAKKAKRS